MFFAMFAIALVGACVLVLTLTGVFNTARPRHLTWMGAETGHIQNRVTDDYNKLSLRGVSLAKAIAADIHNWTRENGIDEKELATRPDLLERLLTDQAGSLLTVLDNNVCSGAFIILDATVNPDAESAAFTKAGVFFKRTNTNNLSSVVSKTHCLRGPAGVARANGLELMGQWRMEFDISNMNFYESVMATARQNCETDLSRLYYWSGRYLMNNNSEHSMMLCVPLIARDSTVYGLCGMEVSDMLFKRLYSPDGTDYPRIFAAFAPTCEEKFDTGGGLVAGNSYLTSQTIGLLIKENSGDGLVSCRSDDKTVYTGMEKAICLYPSRSPYESEMWSLSVLMPESDWNMAVHQSNFIFYGLMVALLIASLFAAVFISRRYIRPVASALALIKSEYRTELPKTQITEIDDLFKYLSTLDEERKALSDELEQAKLQTPEKEQSSPGAPTAFKQFLENLETLTSAEQGIFTLYTEDYTAQQIADKLFITINTVKFHNKNIYQKLGVSSLKELKVYINMIKAMQSHA